MLIRISAGSLDSNGGNANPKSELPGLQVNRPLVDMCEVTAMGMRSELNEQGQ